MIMTTHDRDNDEDEDVEKKNEEMRDDNADP